MSERRRKQKKKKQKIVKLGTKADGSKKTGTEPPGEKDITLEEKIGGKKNKVRMKWIFLFFFFEKPMLFLFNIFVGHFIKHLIKNIKNWIIENGIKNKRCIDRLIFFYFNIVYLNSRWGEVVSCTNLRKGRTAKILKYRKKIKKKTRK